MNNLKITHKIVLLAIGSALFLAIAITSVFNIIFTNNQDKNLSQLESVLRTDYDVLIKEHTDIAVSMLVAIDKHAPALGISSDTTKLLATNVIRDLRYGEAGYFWGDKTDGENVFLKGAASEGTNRMHITDPNGVKLIVEIIDQAKSGGGYTDYMWWKNEGEEPLPKRGYSTLYAPYDWSIGTGNYTNDIDDILSAYEKESKATFRSAMTIQFSILALVILLTTAASIFIGRKMSKPIIRLSRNAESVAEGNLDVEFSNTNKDEIGQLAQSLTKMLIKITEVVSRVSNGASNIAQASQQLSSASQEMSSGANEQASSIEEVSSTMEEITSNIEQNTGNAAQTEQVSKEANEQIKVVADRAGQAVDANQKIAEKITIINDIAFQTNILALNAAVEAARAGEHGKGFAVVAAEVRKLAERSKIAADEIVDLAQSGLEITSSAGEVMGETIPKIETTSKLIQEIAAASMEQNNGANQVNSAIQQLNTITQQNASSSEELATSAEELASQADQLKEIISYFKIKQTNTSSGTYSFKSSTPKPSIEASSSASTNVSDGINIDLSDDDYGTF